MSDAVDKVTNALRQMFGVSDPMTMQEQKAYLDAIGEPIGGQLQQPVLPRTDQGVIPIPPNTEQLIQLLMKRGMTREQAAAMAASRGR